jgi:hypothetical protein
MQRTVRSRKKLVLLACMVGVLGFSVSGCSTGGGDATHSPESKARVREVIKKKFANFGDQTVRKNS